MLQADPLWLVSLTSEPEPRRSGSTGTNMELIPLRIPTGWIIHWNQFMEGDADEAQVNDSEDILWLERIVPEDKERTWKRVNIDLGWYDRGEEELPHFVLRVFEDRFESRIVEFESLEAEEIRERIELILSLISTEGDAGLETLKKLAPE